MKFQKVKNIKIDLESKGMRLDNYLISLLKGIPKSKIYSIIRKGEVRLNSKRIKPRHKIQEGDIVRIPPLKIIENETVKPSSNIVEIIKEKIIFEDKSILVINKPVGIASHGGSGISLGLIEIVRQIIPSYENVQLVHRLDKDTSGCIVLTKKKVC